MASVRNTFALDAAERDPQPHAASWMRAAAVTVECHSDPRSIKLQWQALESQCSLPFMSYAWAEAWYQSAVLAADQEPVIASGRDESGNLLFILPLVLERRGPFRLLLWPGGTHSAYQCGLFSKRCRALVRSVGAMSFWRRVLAALPSADALVCYGVPELASEHDNPLLALPFSDSGCASHRFALSPDWDALYGAKSSAKLRRDERRCERRLAELGEVRFKIAENSNEKLDLIDTMLDQKSAQLRTIGATDFTAAPGVRAFYRRLATSPEWSGVEVFVCALTIDDQPVAINLALIDNGCVHGLVLSMAQTEAGRFGPGRQLLRRVISECCARGLATFDLGAGEDPSKLRWAEETVRRRDVLVALSPKGRAVVWALQAFLTAKSTIKNSPALWRIFSRLRRHLGC